jgi:hypothetical protein
MQSVEEEDSSYPFHLIKLGLQLFYRDTFAFALVPEPPRLWSAVAFIIPLPRVSLQLLVSSLLTHYLTGAPASAFCGAPARSAVCRASSSAWPDTHHQEGGQRSKCRASSWSSKHHKEPLSSTLIRHGLTFANLPARTGDPAHCTTRNK